MERAPPKTHAQLLDIDAAGGTSKECVKGIESSMNKLKANDDDDTHKLSGQDTDGGGGGTLDSLHKEMKQLELCVADDEHLTAGCTIEFMLSGCSFDMLPTADKHRNAFFQAHNKILQFHSKFQKPTPTEPSALCQTTNLGWSWSSSRRDVM